MTQRIYYVAQLAVAGEADASQAKDELLSLIDAAVLQAQSEMQRQLLARARSAAETGRTYSVMRAIRLLMVARPEAPPGNP